MKRILFMLLAATTLFSSCSSDDDTINNGGDNNTPDTKKYTVNLNVKSTGFEVDKIPLRDYTNNIYKLFQYVVYNEDGSVYSDSVYWDENVTPLFNDSNEIPLQLELPEGKYHLAVLYMPYYRSIDMFKTSYQIYAQNFETDYYSNGHPSRSSHDTQNVYYQVTDLTVSSSLNNDVNALTLEPMWSEVTLELKNISKAKKPSEPAILQVSYSYDYKGFSIKTKLGGIGQKSTSSPSWDKQIQYSKEIDTDTRTVTFYPAKGIYDDMGFTISYVKMDPLLQRPTVLATQEIKLDNKFENGRRYKISGNLPDIDLKNPSFSITINDLNPEDINIPFE